MTAPANARWVPIFGAGIIRVPNWPRWVWRCYAATFAAVGMFVLCSLVPMWTVFYFGQVRAVGEVHSLWGMFARTEHTPRADGSWVVYHWQMPALITAVSVHIAAVAGAVIGGGRWRTGGPSASPEVS